MTDAACLHVCVTCRAGGSAEAPPGRALYESVMALRGDAPFAVKPIVCLGNCLQGCSVAMSQPGKWSYLLGHLTPGHAADLVAYGRAFVASRDGTVWRSGRAESLREAIVARVPGHMFTQRETA